MKKIPICVSFLLSAFLFLSCESSDILPSSSPDSPVISDGVETALVVGEDSQSDFDSLFVKDFQGTDFRIAAYDTTFLFPADESNTYLKRLAQRNQLVAETYNINLTFSGDITPDTFYKKLYAEYQSGTDYCDLIVAPVRILRLFISSDMLLNVQSLPFTDYTKPYYNQKAMDSATCANMTYAVFSDYSESFDDYRCIYFNRDLIATFGLENPYALVKQDEWTWERMYEMAKALDGSPNIRFHQVSDQEDFIDILWASSGIPFFNNNPPYAPFMDFQNDKTKSMLGTIKALINHTGTQYRTQAEALGSFSDGTSLFLSGKLSLAPALRDVKLNWGVLPLPKTETGGSYSTYVDDSMQAICVLKNNCDTEKTGIITEALSCASYRIAKEEYPRLCMNYYYRDNDSLLMLDRIIQNPYFDLAYTIGDGHYEIATASYEIVDSVVLRNLDFDKLYTQNIAPFRNFVINNFNVQYEYAKPEE